MGQWERLRDVTEPAKSGRTNKQTREDRATQSMDTGRLGFAISRSKLRLEQMMLTKIKIHNAFVLPHRQAPQFGQQAPCERL